VPTLREFAPRFEQAIEVQYAEKQEPAYLAVCSTMLSDVAVLLLGTGLRLGEALSLEWPHVKLMRANAAKHPFGPPARSCSRTSEVPRRLRATLASADVRNPVGGVGCGRLRHHAADGTFDGHRFTTIRASLRRTG
jgi:integrase